MPHRSIGKRPRSRLLAALAASAALVSVSAATVSGSAPRRVDDAVARARTVDLATPDNRRATPPPSTVSLTAAGSTAHATSATTTSAAAATARSSDASVAQRVQALLSRMTLGEKVRLMYGVARPRGVHSVGYVPGIKRLGIPPLLLSDGPLGVHDSCFAEKYPDNCKLRSSTAMPATPALAASFDPSLAYAYGRTIGAEARARGVDVLYGPAMNIVRVPQGGRNFEYFSEDPYLTGALATSYVQGVQSQDVAAQAKHYILNDEENDRHVATSNADERTIREIYLPAWRKVTGTGGVDSIMCGNNRANGIYNCSNVPLLREVLEGEWGWGGAVGSDYAATTSALGAADGGLDESFTAVHWGKWYDQLAGLVRQGKLSRAIIDDHVRRILTMMFKIGMFDRGRSAGRVRVHADGAVSRTVAERGAVLLKNAGNTLPIHVRSVRSIAVIGQYAGTAMTGGGGSSKVTPYYSISPVRGIRAQVGPHVAVTTADGSNVSEAASLARRAQFAVVVVNDVENEGSDRPNINLPGNQNRLIDAVRAANPRTIVVLNTGSAITMPWLSKVPAVLEMWYPGEEDGAALAQLLFGYVDPSGRLPVTFPVGLAQDCCHTPPRYPERKHSYDYTERLEVGYRWYDAHHLRPLFPFGFGLSYTTFRLDRLSVTPPPIDPGQSVGVHVRVTNTGSRFGIATPQAYLAFPAGVGEPPHRLVATARVPLAPGQSKVLTMTVPGQAFAYWDTAAHNWDVATGTYTLLAGTSSRDLPLHQALQIAHSDGATGIAVRAPSRMASGSSATVQLTVSNTSGSPLTNVACALRAPYGWAVSTVGSVPGQVAAHSSVTAVYRVRAPRGAGPATEVVVGRASWSGVAPGSAAKAASLRVTP